LKAVRTAGTTNATKETRQAGRHGGPPRKRSVTRWAGIAVPAIAAVAVLGALIVTPYLRSLGSPAPAAAAGQAAAGQAAAAAAGQGMASLSVTPGRTARTAGLPTAVRAAGNQYWARHGAASSPKPAPRRQAPAIRPAHTQRPATAGPAGSQRAVVTSSGGHGVSCTGSGGTLKPLNYGAIVTFLTAHGYSGNAAAGIAGNIYQESGGNPESEGDGGGGLIGWTPLPGGYVTGNPTADLQTQLNAILRFNQIWAQYIPTLNAAGTPAQAADIYVTDFERAGIPAYGTREEAAAAVAQACGI